MPGAFLCCCAGLLQWEPPASGAVGGGILFKIRRKLIPETAELFTQQNIVEQREWVDDLCSRIEIDPSVTTICILDTGVNNGHPLLQNLISDEDSQTINSAWGTADQFGHGTEMCGVATFFNLQACFETQSPIKIMHRVESVKIIPAGESNANDPELLLPN
nr:S8 family serine peptidase [uncultured Oscillibacter sp.]